MLKKLLLLIIIPIGIFACSPKKAPTPLPERPYNVASTQVKPAPVYYPVANVRSSSPGYKEYPHIPNRKIILKSFNYDLPEATLCEVGQALATSLKYKFYCAPSLQEKQYSVTRLLTPFELRDLIEKENNVKVSIDQVNREVRVLSGDRIVPQFAK